MTNSDLYNRANVRVIQDEKILTFRHAPLLLSLPQANIFDAPLRCYPVNEEWAKIIMGAVSLLLEVSAWKDATDEGYSGIRQIEEFLVGEHCMDCNDVENCLSTSAIIASLQAQINTNSGNIASNLALINANAANISTNSQNIASNLAKINTNIANISTNTNNIASNLALINTNTAELADHETRITNLENASGGGGSGSGGVDVITNTFSILNTANVNSSSNTPEIKSSLGISHQFTYPTALIFYEAPLRNTVANEYAWLALSVNGVVGITQVRSRQTTQNVVYVAETFYDIDTTLQIEIAPAIWSSSGGIAAINANYPITVTIIEYGTVTTPQTPADYAITFDAGSDAYTLPIDNDGIVEAQGNPGNSLDGQLGQFGKLAVEFSLGAAQSIASVQFDIFADDYTQLYWSLVDLDTQIAISTSSSNSLTPNQWNTVVMPTTDFPATATNLRFVVVNNYDYLLSVFAKIDNIKLFYS